MEEVRRELIAIQRDLVGRSWARLERGGTQESPELARYRAVLDAATARYSGLSGRDDLIEAAAGSRAVFVGDFHTLRQSQRLPLRLMDRLAARPAFARGERQVVLGLEMAMGRHQRAVDRYLAGALDEAAFLRATGYERTWGFPWSSYRPLLDYARWRNIPVLALNSKPPGRNRRLERRDRNAARILARFAADHPQALLVVLFGDLHVADDHLPARFREEMRRLGGSASVTLVFQNISHLYWSLAETGLEQIAEVVRLPDAPDKDVRGRFCVLNATPLARIRSHVYWEESRNEDAHERWGFLGEASWNDMDVPTDEVVELIETLCRFLELPAPDLNRLTVRAGAARGGTRVHLLRARARGVDTTILARRRPRPATDGEVVFLRSVSVDRTAEEASYFVHARASGAVPTDPRPRRDQAYYLLLRHALGFFGSKVFDHLRTTYLEEDLLRLSAERGAGRSRRQRGPAPHGPVPSHVTRVADWLLRYLREEPGAAGPGARSPVPARVPKSLLPTFARAAGYMLGERLYAAMIQGFLRKEEIRALYRAPLTPPGAAESIVAELRKRLQAVQLFYRSREDHL